MTKRALVLFAHGARDARWAEPFQRLQQRVQAQAPETSVSLAFLELMEPRLPEKVGQLVEAQCLEITIVPVFFGQGGHLLRDLPLIIEQLKVDHPQLAIKVAKAVGEDEGVLNAIASYCVGELPAV